GLFVTTIGNLGGAGQILQGLVQMAGTSYQSLVPGFQFVILAFVGLYNWIFNGATFPIGTDWYWASTRVISGTINEFPYFTFLYADLHAHLIGLPFTLLAMALAVNLVLSRPLRLSVPAFASVRLGAVPVAIPRAQFPSLPMLRDVSRSATWATPEGLLRLWLTGLVVGALFPINTWDMPTYLGLVALAGLLPWYFVARHDVAALVGAVARLAAIVALAYVLFLPYHRYSVQFYSAVQWAPPEHSELSGYLLIHGFFLT